MTSTCRYLSILIISLTIGLTVSMPAAHAQGKWVKLAPFPEPAEELLGAVAGGKFYVFAGLAPGYKPMGLVYEYNPGANQWTKKKPMALPSHHVALTVYRDKIYAFGGFVLPPSGPAAWVAVNNAWEYDATTDTWKALAPMPTKRGSPVAATVGDKIYVIGGATALPGAADEGITGTRPQTSVGTVEEYDPAANTWRQRSSMPTPRNHAAVGVVNGKVYVIGGRVGSAFISAGSTNIFAVEEYDPATDRWGAPRARMLTPRSASAYGVYNGRIYVAGGEFQDAHMAGAFRALEAYDPVADAWTEMPFMPLQRHGLAGGVLGNRLYLVSGDVQSGGGGVDVATPEADAFEFDGAYR